MSRNADPLIFGLVQDTTSAELDSSDVHGGNHNSSEADQEVRTRCIVCSSSQLLLVGQILETSKNNPLDLYQFLHEECPSPRCRPSDNWEMQICDFCRHLRLRHTLGCVSKLHIKLFRKYSMVDLEVDFGCLQAIRSRQNCGLCRLVANTVLIHGQEAPAGNLSSITNLVKLRIRLHRNFPPAVAVKCNLLKGATYIALMVEDFRTPVSRRFSHLRSWPAPVGEDISWDRIRKSLPLIPPSPIGRLPSRFRLIDVLQRRCVTVGPSFNGSFAALSYVWGSGMGVGQAGPAADLQNLPYTIEDALHACKELGQKYLWIDQICINQDDPVDKANQIASMAAIYSSASLVIVAARGESVHSGISGMHLARRKLQARESFLDFEFSSVPDFDRDISSSIWSTRGWTFQEVALAKIKVYFSPTGVWIQYEKQGREVRYSVEFGHSTSPRRIEHSTPFTAFSKHLGEYTPRKLTYEYDIYNAFSGIMMALFGSLDKDIYGLPEQYFDQALLWAPSKGGPPLSIRVFRNDRDGDLVLNPLLPTWSWASLMGEVETMKSAQIDQMISLVKWARIDPIFQSSTPTLINPQIPERTWNYDSINLFETRCFLAILWSYSGFDSPSPFALQLNDHTPINLKTETLKQRWPSQRDFWHEVSSRSSRSPTYPGLGIPGFTVEDDSKIAQLQPGVLLTRAQLAHVWVDPDGYFRDGDHGTLIGRLYGGDRELALRVDSPKTRVFECVAISLAYAQGEQDDFIFDKCQDTIKTRQDIWSDETDWSSRFGAIVYYTYQPVINVMLIGREGEFSYRLGIGWIFFRRWIDLESVFETILLK